MDLLRSPRISESVRNLYEPKGQVENLRAGWQPALSDAPDSSKRTIASRPTPNILMRPAAARDALWGGRVAYPRSRPAQREAASFDCQPVTESHVPPSEYVTSEKVY